MKFKTASIIFVSIMALGLFAYEVAWGGWYPIAIVNYHIITEQTLERNTDIVYGFSRNIAALAGADAERVNSQEFFSEVKLKVLDDLISRELISQELKKTVGLSEAGAIAQKNISQALSGKKDTAEGIEKLYGLSLDEFKSAVLIPQAYQEILAGRMHLNNQDFDTWLSNARKKGSVLIFYPGFSWADGKLISK